MPELNGQAFDSGRSRVNCSRAQAIIVSLPTLTRTTCKVTNTAKYLSKPIQDVRGRAECGIAPETSATANRTCG
jgi:hypothetical protein